MVTKRSYFFKINNENTGIVCEICSKLMIKKQEQDHWCRSGDFIVNFKNATK